MAYCQVCTSHKALKLEACYEQAFWWWMLLPIRAFSISHVSAPDYPASSFPYHSTYCLSCSDSDSKWLQWFRHFFWEILSGPDCSTGTQSYKIIPLLNLSCQHSDSSQKGGCLRKLYVHWLPMNYGYITLSFLFNSTVLVWYKTGQKEAMIHQSI